jgi:hypothetical protein
VEDPRMNDIVKLIMDSGTTIAVLAYFIYRDFKFMNKLDTSLTVLNETVNLIKDIELKKNEED